MLEKHDSELLRKKFRNHIADTIKSKKDTKVFFSQILKSPFRGVRHIYRDWLNGKMFFSLKVDDGFIENLITVATFVNRHKQVKKNIVNIYSSSRTHEFNMNWALEISLWELENVQPLIKSLFSTKKVPSVLIEGRLTHFSKAWKKLTRDQSILYLVDGYVISFQRKIFFNQRFLFNW